MKRFLVLAAVAALAAPAALAQPTDPRTACLADVQKLCQGVQRGGGRILQCLKQHDDQLSPACKSALAAAIAARKQGNPPPGQ